MKSINAKLFIHRDCTKIVNVVYSSDEYYKIVKENCENGLKQVIITSDMMTKILHDYFFQKKYNITGIEFMEDDSTLNREINNILLKLKEDRAYINDLLNKINFLSEESAIDIKMIELRGRDDQNQAVKIVILVNGVYSITDKVFEKESNDLLAMIERCLC
nr:hypothetical protein [uncultured Anaerosporobacter sp.]